jgi:cytochrome c
MVSGFAAEQLFHHEPLETQAFNIGGSDLASAAKEQVESAPAGPEPIAPLLASADAGRGQSLFKACVACHTPNDGGANKVGPNLWNVIGSSIAGTEGFKYSSALRKMGGTWDYETLNQFLFKPKTFVPGTKMTYAGIKAAKKRADIIAYIRSLSAAPQPLP